MSEQAAQRMYALALSLVPDAEMAADLVWRSKNEDDLRRRALAWRRSNGLPALESAQDEPLPALSPDDQTLAVHLYRRGMRRRRGRAVGAMLMAGLLLVGAVVGLKYTALAVPRGLAADPAFAGEALVWTPGTQDLQLLVYKAEAYPGAITVWWELLGPGAGKAAEGVSKNMRLRVPAEVDAIETELTVHRSNRVLGRSLFAQLSSRGRFDLVLENAGGQPVNWALEITPDRLPQDPAAITYNIDKSFTILGEQVDVQSIRVGKYATTVVFDHSQAPSTYSYVEISVDEQTLPRLGSWLATTRPKGEAEVVLQPIPQGGRLLQILLPIDQTETKQYTWQLPAPEVFQEFRREGNTLYLAFRPDFEVPQDAFLQLRDHEGYLFHARAVKDYSSGELVLKAEVSLTYRGFIRASGLPGKPDPGELRPAIFVAGELTEVSADVPYPVPPPQLTIDVQTGQIVEYVE